jgi:peptide/nickel transport system substrate-binding protein
VKARALLSEAGYPDGRGFPPIQLQANADGFGYVQVAEAVQEMLERELHVPISISMVRANEHYDRVEHGRARFWREGWTADHPDPENFLSLFYGRNAVSDTAQPASINMTRFHDAAFDGRFAMARRTVVVEERYRLLAAADSVMMARMPIIPLYHENAAYLVQPWVHGLALNPIEFLDLSKVWVEPKPQGPVAQ